MAGLFRSRPNEIEAVQWTGENSVQDLVAFAGDKVRVGSVDDVAVCSLLAGKYGAQGWVPVPSGHWIVRNPGDHSDYWPVDPGYFAVKYEEVR